MAHENSPSSVMYAELKILGISNRDAAIALLDVGRSFGETTLLDRVESRSQLSRYVVHVAPGEIAPNLFKDFKQTSQVLCGRALAKLKAGGSTDPAGELCQRLSGPSAQAMLDALRLYGLDENVYRNALSHIANLDVPNASDRALLYMMLFVVTGCTGDPYEGARATERFSADNVGSSFKTTETAVGLAEVEDSGEDDLLLGLARIVGGKLKGANAFYHLAPTEQGTEIGTLAAGDGAITDVDEDVSRRHARVYKQGGHWYVIGLGSTNGTSVISGEDKLEHVVEPPKRDRDRGWSPEPYEIFPTDTICLGSSTRFMVMPFMG